MDTERTRRCLGRESLWQIHSCTSHFSL